MGFDEPQLGKVMLIAFNLIVSTGPDTFYLLLFILFL